MVVGSKEANLLELFFKDSKWVESRGLKDLMSLGMKALLMGSVMPLTSFLLFDKEMIDDILYPINIL